MPSCCDTGPRFLRSHTKGRPVVVLDNKQGVLRICFNLDSHGTITFGITLNHIRLIYNNYVKYVAF